MFLSSLHYNQYFHDLLCFGSHDSYEYNIVYRAYYCTMDCLYGSTQIVISVAIEYPCPLGLPDLLTIYMSHMK